MDTKQLFEDLLKETSDNSKMDFDKIKELMAKSAEMREEQKKRAATCDEYFANLRKRINESSDYLNKAKKDLNNISFACEREKLRSVADNMEYESFLTKSDEEIDAEMQKVKDQLAELDGKVQSLNSNMYGAEDIMEKSIKTLENISRGLYSGDN